mmetsp:Transcript_29514/g.70259  ORF Transcript_29514/g.70259 Transcript_29514/m.70259 type:complete len:382 (-) Transcript_29514:63-1208(-)
MFSGASVGLGISTSSISSFPVSAFAWIGTSPNFSALRSRACASPPDSAIASGSDARTLWLNSITSAVLLASTSRRVCSWDASLRGVRLSSTQSDPIRNARPVSSLDTSGTPAYALISSPLTTSGLYRNRGSSRASCTCSMLSARMVCPQNATSRTVSLSSSPYVDLKNCLSLSTNETQEMLNLRHLAAVSVTASSLASRGSVSMFGIWRRCCTRRWSSSGNGAPTWRSVPDLPASMRRCCSLSVSITHITSTIEAVSPSRIFPGPVESLPPVEDVRERELEVDVETRETSDPNAVARSFLDRRDFLDLWLAHGSPAPTPPETPSVSSTPWSGRFRGRSAPLSPRDSWVRLRIERGPELPDSDERLEGPPGLLPMGPALPER